MINNNQSDDFTDVGKLQVKVTLPEPRVPISGATVRINRGDTVLDELTTDSSGQTPAVDLQTPPFEYSQDPQGRKPYAEYDLQISAPEHETIYINGVQLLPQTTALQNVRMPQTGATGIYIPNDINIEQHTLWGDFPPKIIEDEVKPLPETEGYVVLPEPVIPEYIIVHLGVPTDTSARNVWIPFKDYIKNVASSEIYSTWPKETIRANILVIVSFTLNRVYTEWYRGKGYDFTITNSTAYDQAFVYGRNIYEDISVIVDELFSTYVTRPDIHQPLFTQYCDGNRVRCENMLEQWGSKGLGESGYDAIRIVRYYYGSDVYMTSAKKVEGVPMSFPGYVLKVGASGQDVRMIQEQLNTIANNYPALPKLRVDGQYGDTTAQAVSTFQQIFGLPQTGTVDFSTWYQISNVYVAVTKMSELG